MANLNYTKKDTPLSDLIPLKSLYPSINVNRVLSLILNLLYSNPTKYFPKEYDGLGNLLPIPTRANFLKLMNHTLTKYSIFRCRTGVYRQLEGLSMGSCLSSIISNLFVHMMEIDVIKKFEKSGDIISWLRYADDIFCIIKNRSFPKIFKKLNSWDKDLFFTYTNMTENSLIFLDCELFLEDEKIEFKHYPKFGLNTILQNYEKSITPKRYLISNIWTQFHNVESASSNDFYLAEGLKIMETIFYRNGYPKALVKNKMKKFLEKTKNLKK